MKRTMGNFIRQLREEKRLTQAELAKDLNVSPSTIGMWENDERSPNEDKKEMIADYFNVDMNYLYGKTLVRNSYREIDDTLGDYDANIEYLTKNYPDLIELYNEIEANEQLIILFDKAKKLSPEDLAQVLRIIDTFNRESE